MASTIKVKEILHRVSVALNDISPQFDGWTERELVEWLNDGQMAITKFLPSACSRLDAIRLLPGTRQSIEAIQASYCKPGDGSTPSSTIYGKQFLFATRNMGADGATAGRAVRVGDRRRKDVQSPLWHTITSSEVLQYFFDPQTPRYFYVSPAVPASPQVWIEVAYTAQPIQIPNTGTPGAELYKWDGSSTTVISIDDEHVDDLTNYVLARARMKDMAENKPGEASAYTALFTASINAKAAALTGHNPNLKRLPMVAEPAAAAS
jgi:hypothetical protein